jgi:hypothetical protein
MKISEDQEWLPFSRIHEFTNPYGPMRTFLFMSAYEAEEYSGWAGSVLTVEESFRVDYHSGDQTFHADWRINGESVYSYDECRDDPNFENDESFHEAMEGAFFMPIEGKLASPVAVGHTEIKVGVEIVNRCFDNTRCTIAAIDDESVLTECGEIIEFIPIPWDGRVRLPSEYVCAEKGLPLFAMCPAAKRENEAWIEAFCERGYYEA